MEPNKERKTCALSGYTADGKFEEDICPQCGEKCNFLNVTRYIPECGGPGRVDLPL